MLKAEYKDRYKKRNEGTGVVSTVFRYLLSGKEDVLNRYRKILEDQDIPVHTDEKSGKIIYFDTSYHGATCTVGITDNDRIVVEDATLDFLQSQMNLATDPTVKQALANKIADYMVNKIAGGVAIPAAPAPVAQTPAAPATEKEANLED